MVTLALMQNLIWGKPLKMTRWCHYVRFITPYKVRLWRLLRVMTALKILLSCLKQPLCLQRYCQQKILQPFHGLQVYMVSRTPSQQIQQDMSRWGGLSHRDLISYSALIMKPLNNLFFLRDVTNVKHLYFPVWSKMEEKQSMDEELWLTVRKGLNSWPRWGGFTMKSTILKSSSLKRISSSSVPFTRVCGEPLLMSKPWMSWLSQRLLWKRAKNRRLSSWTSRRRWS